MEQSQTPGDLVQHPEYDGKKALLVLKEKLTREGLDDSLISVKLKEAHDAIERACNAFMVTHEGDKQIFWDDAVFNEYHFNWITTLKIAMRKKGSSASEVSDAIKKARRALHAAKQACTTDTERAELLRIKNPFEDEVYQMFEADQVECGYRDKVAVLQEHLIRVGADKCEISTRLKEAEAAIERVFSICAFNDKEKRIFRGDTYGIHSPNLFSLMRFRLQNLGRDEVTIEETITMAYDAMRDAEKFFHTWMERCKDLEDSDTEHGFTDEIEWHQTDDEKEGGSSKRPRMN